MKAKRAARGKHTAGLTEEERWAQREKQLEREEEMRVWRETQRETDDQEGADSQPCVKM